MTTTSFVDLGVPARMAEALANAGITEAFPVQAITLPDALAGRDLCGRAPTGSGKTLGFGIPMLARVGQATPNRPTGLVLVPTRELAEQVQRAFVPLGRAAWRFVQAIYGGAPMGGQIHSLRKGASVIVATPGRLLDIIEQGHCDLSGIEVCVIDEADRMADLGFMPDVRKILDMTPESRQTMLWSATLDGDVNELVRDYLRDPAMHDLVGEVHSGPVEHRFVVQPAMQRLDATVELLDTHGPTIMFVKTRFGVDDVTAALMNAGVRAGSLHGARTQAARSRTLDDFKRGKVQVLVATDVAARGIHVDDVELVVHYDLPDNEKDYQHRSGRTGRAGRAGTVVAFVPPSRKRVAQRLAAALEHDVVWSEGDRPAVRGDRPAIEADVRDRHEDRPRGNRSFERPSYGDRNGAPRSDRPSYSDRTSAPRSDRPSYGDRTSAPRSDRPSYGDRTSAPRSDRPSYGDRTSAPRSDRPSYGDRTSAPRSDRPSYGDRNGAPRSDRPSYGDRNGAPRSDRPSYGDRTNAPRSDRPSYGDRTGTPRSDRPSYGDRTGTPRSDRPSYGDRPAHGDRPNTGRGPRPTSGERTSAGRSPRPAAAGGRPAGPVRRPR